MFFLVDKPLELSSFDVIRQLRKSLNIKKMGHTGTLDPLASGLLLIATENSTKLIPALEGYDKTYQCTVRLDGASESLDLGSEVHKIDTTHYKKLDTKELISRLESLEEQTPPKYSALHIDGKRAYELARNGIDFEIPKRKISIKNVEILHEENAYEYTIRLRISSGGYIRSLAPEIGKWCGVEGGYITQLRREILHFPGGDISLSDATHLASITEQSSLSYHKLFPHFLHQSISQEQKEILLQGKSLPLDFLDTKASGNILLSCDDFISWCTFEGGICKVQKNNV